VRLSTRGLSARIAPIYAKHRPEGGKKRGESKEREGGGDEPRPPRIDRTNDPPGDCSKDDHPGELEQAGVDVTFTVCSFFLQLCQTTGLGRYGFPKTSSGSLGVGLLVENLGELKVRSNPRPQTM